MDTELSIAGAKPTPEQITAFANLFRGNPDAHYVRENGEYRRVDGAITIADTEQHLAGGSSSLLSIPILTDGNCYFGALDVDRHLDSDPPVDHAALAVQITRLGLPLAVCRSKNPKSAHCWLFIREEAGCSATIVRRLLERYRQVLAITGEVEVFPKQERLEPGKVGNGINLPFHGESRIAFGAQGEEIDLPGFLQLAQERRSYGQILANRDLTTAPSAPGSAPDSDERPLPIDVVHQLHQKNLESLRSAPPGNRNDVLNTTSFFAGRAFASKAFEESEAAIKNAIRDAALAAGLNDREISGTGASGWNSGLGRPLLIIDPKRKLIDIKEWVNNRNVPVPPLDQAVADSAVCDPLEIDRLRKDMAARLGVSVPALKGAITRQRQARAERKTDTLYELRSDTTLAIREGLANLLLTTTSERDELGLPLSQESADQRAEELLWDYVRKQAQVFCTNGGLGYLLFNDKKEQPIPVARDGYELNDFLTSLGIHSGARARNRLGKHLGTMCWREGARVEPRISFHFDSKAYVAYFAEGPGELIRISASEITRVPNGTDGQLFLFPRNYEPWHLDLDALPPSTDFCPDANALLPQLLFDVLEFENESLIREDLHVLLNAYVATLFLPNIVAGKLLLQVLGDTGSGKTLFLRLLGRLIYGQHFEVTGLDTDEKQVENAIVNNSFVAFDDVKRTSNSAILGIIRRACTGGACKRRELYSTFGEITEPYRAAIAITCSEEPFTSSDEMSNRALIIRAKQRDNYLDEKSFLQKLDRHRDRLMAEMVVRLQNVIIAVKAQCNFEPSLKSRMAGFSTFLLRVARQWDWGVSAQHVLDVWREEQIGAGLDPSIMETLDRWMSREGWEKSKRYSAAELCRELEKVNISCNIDAWWHGKDAALVRALRRAFHAYQNHYGFCFIGRTSGPKPGIYWFEPSDELLKQIRERMMSRASGQTKISF